MKIVFITTVLLAAIIGCTNQEIKNKYPYPDLDLESYEPVVLTEEELEEAKKNVPPNPVVPLDTNTRYSTPKEKAWIARQQQSIKYRLKDPSSAQFRNLNIIYIEGAPIVLGEVNSRNSFAGYTGFKRFVAADTLIAIENENMSSHEMDKLIRKLNETGTTWVVE
ncbi:MAG: hypothetical protein ABFR47_02990 [Verrucomicrobiota bacterium]